MKNIKNIIEESIKTEDHMAKLYKIYSEKFIEDSDFWLKLKEEEMNHSSLLKSMKFFLKMNKIPKEMFIDNISEIVSTNFLIKEFIENITKNNISKKEAYEFALNSESSAQEIHFQSIMHNKFDSKIINIFQKLNNGDTDHYNRIKILYDKIDN